MSQLLDDEFVRYLRVKELQDNYTKAIERAIAEVEEEFEQKEKDLSRGKLEGLEIDKWHRNALNACIFPFTESESLSKMGYHFVRGSPLLELGITNLDFLIFNPDKGIAIIGDAKGSIGDEGRVVEQMQERMYKVRSNQRYLQTNYLNSAEVNDEFVLGVSFSDANRLCKCLLRRNGGVVVWQSGIDFRDSDVKLGIVAPGREDGPVGRTMMHSDEALNRALVNVKTSYEFKTFFLESHPVAKMTILTIVDVGKDDGIFTTEDLEELVKNEIGYAGEIAVKKQTDAILRMGLAVGFVKEEAPGAYRVGTRSKKAKNRYDELVRLWIKYAIEQDIYPAIEARRTALQAQFTEERKKFGFIDET